MADRQQLREDDDPRHHTIKLKAMLDEVRQHAARTSPRSPIRKPRRCSRPPPRSSPADHRLPAL
jgi:hypothetical protein